MRNSLLATPTAPSPQALSHLRRTTVAFLLQSTLKLTSPPIIKYTSLTLFADRFLPSLTKTPQTPNHWLLHRPFAEPNLQLFALVSIWLSTKIHATPSPLSVKTLKSLADALIHDQHFTTKDFVEAEVVFLQVIGFELGVSSIGFVYLEEYLMRFRELARVGEFVSFEACMDVLDVLYESEEMSVFSALAPKFLAAAVLVVGYVVTVPKQQWEFPILPWMKFVTSYEVSDIEELVRKILYYIVSN